MHDILMQVTDVSLASSLLMEKEFINLHKNLKQHLAAVECSPLWLLKFTTLPYEELDETVRFL